VSPAGPQDSFFRGGRGVPLPFRQYAPVGVPLPFRQYAPALIATCSAGSASEQPSSFQIGVSREQRMASSGMLRERWCVVPPRQTNPEAR
jgi:hypothetical protein